MFETRLMAGWGDMDFNSHMRNTAYLDKAADVRMVFFAANGFPMSEFQRLNIGPVIFKDELEYFKEVNLLEELTVTLELGGLTEDGGRFLITNDFYRADGSLAARVTSRGGWLDRAARRLTPPPPKLLAALQSLARTGDSRDRPGQLFMVVEHYKNADPLPVYRRFRDQGRMAPEGLEYMSSWVDHELKHCYQLMRTQDPALLNDWISNWSDLVDFEVIPVMTSKEAADRIAPRL